MGWGMESNYTVSSNLLSSSCICCVTGWPVAGDVCAQVIRFPLRRGNTNVMLGGQSAGTLRVGVQVISQSTSHLMALIKYSRGWMGLVTVKTFGSIGIFIILVVSKQDKLSLEHPQASATTPPVQDLQSVSPGCQCHHFALLWIAFWKKCHWL